MKEIVEFRVQVEVLDNKSMFKHLYRRCQVMRECNECSFEKECDRVYNKIFKNIQGILS